MLNRFKKSEFLRNVFTLMTGTAIAQAIPLLISPIISRLYTPGDFGVLAMFVSISSILGIISTGRYELAIMLPKAKRDARNILILSLAIAVAISLIALMLIIIFHQTIIHFFEAPEIGPWLYLAPVMILFMGVYQAFNYWSTRNKTFKLNAASRISQSSTIAATNLAVGATVAGPTGLIAGVLLGQIVAGLVLAWKTIRNPQKLIASFSASRIKKNARKYSNFAKYNTPHAFVDTLQDQGLVFVIIVFFTRTVLGSYSFAYRILKAPAGLIGSAMYQVFYQKASRAFEEQIALRPLVLKFYRNLFLIGFPVFSLLFIFSPDIFSFVFGAQYRMAGEISQIIIPWLFLNFLAMPVSCLAIVVNKQKEAFLITIIEIILRFGSIIYGGVTGNYKLAFILMSISCSGVMIFALFWYYKIAGMNKKVNTYKD